MGDDANAQFAKWKGLFDWSMKFQDGTHPTEFKQMDKEKQEWLQQVMDHHTQDFGKRMKVISEGLAEPGDSDETAAQKEELLEELTDICESIDFARDLGKVGGLPCVITLLSSPREGIRSRAAELLAVCAANNPPVQKEFIEAGVLEKMVPLIDEESSVVSTKALLAVSSLVRGFPLGTALARRLGVVGKLVHLVTSKADDVRACRKSLQLLHFFLSQAPEEQRLVLDAGLPGMLPDCLKSTDVDTARWALEVSHLLAASSHSAEFIKGCPNLKDALAVLSADLAKHDREAVAEELVLVDKMELLLQ